MPAANLLSAAWAQGSRAFPAPGRSKAQAVSESEESAFSYLQSLLVDVSYEFLCWTDKRGSVFLSRLFNRFDGEYTEGATKKHRPKERCRVLDKNDTIIMRNLGFLKGFYKLYSIICRFFFLSFFFQNR